MGHGSCVFYNYTWILIHLEKMLFKIICYSLSKKTTCTIQANNVFGVLSLGGYLFLMLQFKIKIEHQYHSEKSLISTTMHLTEDKIV